MRTLEEQKVLMRDQLLFMGLVNVELVQAHQTELYGMDEHEAVATYHRERMTPHFAAMRIIERRDRSTHFSADSIGQLGVSSGR